MLGAEHNLTHHSLTIFVQYIYFRIYHTSSIDYFDGAFRSASDPSPQHDLCALAESRVTWVWIEIMESK